MYSNSLLSLVLSSSQLVPVVETLILLGSITVPKFVLTLVTDLVEMDS